MNVSEAATGGYTHTEERGGDAYVRKIGREFLVDVYSALRSV